MTSPAPISPRTIAIGQSDQETMEWLVRSMIGDAADPKIGFAMQMQLFAASVLDELPPPPGDKIVVQEALSLECRSEVHAGQEVEVTGERLSTPQTHLFRLTAIRPSAPAEPAATLTARLRLVDPGLPSRQVVRDAQRADSPSLVAAISAEHLSAFSVLAGDTNPIHTDLALARSLGLGERVVHGPLLVFLVESALSAAGIDGKPAKFQMRFFGPAYAGQTLQFAVSGGMARALDVSRARVCAIRPDGMICVAADVLIRD